jgi:two-component system nitrate/nitrite response regulator NarL
MQPDPEPEVTPNGRRIRVLVVDDHDLFRVGLVAALTACQDIEVAAQASAGKPAVQLARELKPDVVLMALRLPDLNPKDATQLMFAADTSIRIVMLTTTETDSDIEAAVDAGARGYILKDSAIDDIGSAIRAAATNTAWLSPRATQALLDRMRRHPAHASAMADALKQLSQREIEVLHRLVRGLDNNEIALELCISPPTVKNHVSNILAKLGVSNRIQAAVYAVRHGIA